MKTLIYHYVPTFLVAVAALLGGNTQSRAVICVSFVLSIGLAHKLIRVAGPNSGSAITILIASICGEAASNSWVEFAPRDQPKLICMGIAISSAICIQTITLINGKRLPNFESKTVKN